MHYLTIKFVQKPLEPNTDEDLLWLCKSLGFVSLRDTEETAAKIFKAIVDATKEGKTLSSDEIAHLSDITRGTAVYHLREYIQAGMVTQNNKKYTLRTRSLHHTLEEMEHDMIRMFEDMKRIAKEIDSQLGLKER